MTVYRRMKTVAATPACHLMSGVIARALRLPWREALSTLAAYNRHHVSLRTSKHSQRVCSSAVWTFDTRKHLFLMASGANVGYAGKVPCFFMTTGSANGTDCRGLLAQRTMVPRSEYQDQAAQGNKCQSNRANQSTVSRHQSSPHVRHCVSRLAWKAGRRWRQARPAVHWRSSGCRTSDTWGRNAPGPS